MSVDVAMERLYERVELVRGAGDRWRGQFCLMSFVALLAGEAHTDHPRAASLMIRRYGIVINDEMPSEMRQRLKPFAPRIVNTRDGLDRERAQLLVQAWRTEIVPQLLVDFGRGARTTDQRTAGLLACPLAHRGTAAREHLATAIARLIAHYAHAVPYGGRDWYWFKAIDLLDRLCEIRDSDTLGQFGAEQAVAATLTLDRSMTPRMGIASAALSRIRSLIPATKD